MSNQCAAGAAKTPRLRLAAQPSALAQLSEWAQDVAHEYDLSPRSAFRLELVLVEVVTNAIEYAYKTDAATAEVNEAKDQATEEDYIDVWIMREAGQVVAQVEDSGFPFDPTNAPSHLQPANLDVAPIGGIGLHWVRAYTSHLRYRRIEHRNQLHLSIAADE
jgi:anti-sigma regulatory factor (Ser/Thr protein kinase)